MINWLIALTVLIVLLLFLLLIQFHIVLFFRFAVIEPATQWQLCLTTEKCRSLILSLVLSTAFHYSSAGTFPNGQPRKQTPVRPVRFRQTPDPILQLNSKSVFDPNKIIEFHIYWEFIRKSCVIPTKKGIYIYHMTILILQVILCTLLLKLLNLFVIFTLSLLLPFTYF